MQIPMGNNRRVDLYGNAKDGVYIEMVNDKGITYVQKKLSEEERLSLVEKLTSMGNGRAV